MKVHYIRQSLFVHQTLSDIVHFSKSCNPALMLIQYVQHDKPENWFKKRRELTRTHTVDSFLWKSISFHPEAVKSDVLLDETVQQCGLVLCFQ